MIQRKQTLFLLAAAIVSIIDLFVPFLAFDRASEPFTINLLEGISQAGISSNIYFPFTINVLTIIITFIAIFLYKNRILQYKIVNGGMVLNVFTTGLFFLLDFVNVSDVSNLRFTFGAFLPIIGAIFAFLAAHFIKKDEQLVRSTDRIR